jgi:hypothetical protein
MGIGRIRKWEEEIILTKLEILKIIKSRSRQPIDTFESFFQEPFIQEAVKLYQVKLIIYNPLQEVIITWKD